MKPASLFAASILVLLSACSRGADTPPITPTPDPYASRLSEDVWEQVQARAWYRDGDYDSAGENLLEVIAGAGPLWRSGDSLRLLDAYPQGIPDETLATARTYARMTLAGLHEVILDDWLVDGIDDYERAILDAAAERRISVSALRRALAGGLFRETYEEMPEMLTAARIDAVGSLSPHVLRLLEEQDWFSDGIDSYEASLLGILNTLLTVDEQMALLETGNHRPLPLSSGDIAAVYLGEDEGRIDRVHEVASAWMREIEAFVGEFRPVGLVIDTTEDDAFEACHTGDGGGTRPGRIGLPAEYCLQAPVLIHELAHAFIGGRYPTWFSEGVAEMVAYHLTGSRAGYYGGEGRIELEARPVILSPVYRNQSALGADFLEAVYYLAGEDEMSAFIQDVAGLAMSGEQLLDRIRQMSVPDRQELEDVIAEYTGSVLAAP